MLRTARLLRSYNVLGRLKKLSPAVARNEEVIRAALDLAVFILIAASLVYITQHGTNEKIADFVDALYFIVAALSTTGFGDVTLIGSTSGELPSVAMMIVGITLFFRLAQAAFRPGGKVWHPCPQCGLLRHDPDAVHCKACGRVPNIPDDRSEAAGGASAHTPADHIRLFARGRCCGLRRGRARRAETHRRGGGLGWSWDRPQRGHLRQSRTVPDQSHPLSSHTPHSTCAATCPDRPPNSRRRAAIEA